MTQTPLPSAQTASGLQPHHYEPPRDLLRCYHAALASEQTARMAGAFGDDEMRQLYLEQARWRTALALRYLGCPCRSSNGK